MSTNLLSNPRGRTTDGSVVVVPDYMRDDRRAIIEDAVDAYNGQVVVWSTAEPTESGVTWANPDTGAVLERTRDPHLRLDNLVLNPIGEGATDLDHWEAPTGTGVTFGLEEVDGSPAGYVRYVSGFGVFPNDGFEVEEGVYAAIAADIRTEDIYPTRLSMRVGPYSAGFRNTVVDAEDDFQRFSWAVELEEDYDNFRAGVGKVASGAAYPAPSLHFRRVHVALGDTEQEALDQVAEYGDGDSPGWEWEGEPHASPSFRPSDNGVWEDIDDPAVMAAIEDYLNFDPGSPDPDLTYTDGDLVAPAPVGWAGNAGPLYYSQSRDALALYVQGAETWATATGYPQPDSTDDTATYLTEVVDSTADATLNIGAQGVAPTSSDGFNIPAGGGTMRWIRENGINTGTNVRPVRFPSAADATAVIGEKFYVRGLLTDEHYTGGYADGDTPGWAWEGEPHQSASYLIPPRPAYASTSVTFALSASAYAIPAGVALTSTTFTLSASGTRPVNWPMGFVDTSVAYTLSASGATQRLGTATASTAFTLGAFGVAPLDSQWVPSHSDSTAIKARAADKPLEIISYSVSEDATPLDPGSMEGGYGEIILDGLTENNDIFLRDEPVALHDFQRGRTSGTVAEVSVTQPQVTITADSVLGMLNSWHHIPVVNGTLEDLVRTWFNAAEITSPIEFQDGIAERPIVSAAHNDNLWDRFKLLMSAQQIEAALVDNVIVLRVPRKFEAYTNRQISTGWTVGRGDTAEFVEIKYYTTQYFDNQEFYPILMDTESDDELQIMQVESDEIAEYAIEMNVTLDIWPENPIRVESGVPNAPVGYSVYSVVGNDDLPIPPQMWNDYGGRLWVEPHEDDPHIIVVKVEGAAIPRLAPFRIAMSSGAGNYYNSLRLVGSGVVVEEHLLTLRTGASRNTTGNKVGLTVENPYVTSLTQAYDTGLKTAAAYSGLRSEIIGQALNINRRNDHDDTVNLASIDRELFARDIQTIADFTATYMRHTLGTLSNEWDALAEEFAVQAFGNAAGARVLENDSFYRIVTANFNIDTMDYNAVIDNTIADFNVVWEDASLADVSAQWEGRSLADFSVATLRRN